MIRVIETIVFDEQTLRNVPEFSLGPGLLVTVDAEQRPTLLVKPGTTARVHRPDGTCIERIVAGVEVWRSQVGLFFPKTAQHEIPISSEIELAA